MVSPIAPILDLACLCVFVLLGRESHGVDGGPWWFLTVLWPFVAGWFAAALALRVYPSPARLQRVVATALIGTAAGLLARAVVTHRDVPPAFIGVALGFIVLSTVGWRVAVGAITRRAQRRA